VILVYIEKLHLKKKKNRIQNTKEQSKKLTFPFYIGKCQVEECMEYKLLFVVSIGSEIYISQIVVIVSAKFQLRAHCNIN